MRVFVITKAVPPKTGGLEAWTFQLAGLLAAAKYSVTVIVTGAQKSSEIPHRDDLEVLCLEGQRNT
jgi:hypothetical protein